MARKKHLAEQKASMQGVVQPSSRRSGERKPRRRVASTESEGREKKQTSGSPLDSTVSSCVGDSIVESDEETGVVKVDQDHAVSNSDTLSSAHSPALAPPGTSDVKITESRVESEEIIDQPQIDSTCSAAVKSPDNALEKDSSSCKTPRPSTKAKSDDDVSPETTTLAIKPEEKATTETDVVGSSKTIDRCMINESSLEWKFEQSEAERGERQNERHKTDNDIDNDFDNDNEEEEKEVKVKDNETEKHKEQDKEKEEKNDEEKDKDNEKVTDRVPEPEVEPATEIPHQEWSVQEANEDIGLPKSPSITDSWKEMDTTGFSEASGLNGIDSSDLPSPFPPIPDETTLPDETPCSPAEEGDADSEGSCGLKVDPPSQSALENRPVSSSWTVLIPPPSKRMHLSCSVLDSLVITDVKVDLVTVTFRECRTDKGFFRDSS